MAGASAGVRFGGLAAGGVSSLFATSAAARTPFVGVSLGTAAAIPPIWATASAYLGAVGSGVRMKAGDVGSSSVPLPELAASSPVTAGSSGTGSPLRVKKVIFSLRTER